LIKRSLARRHTGSASAGLAGARLGSGFDAAADATVGVIQPIVRSQRLALAAARARIGVVASASSYCCVADQDWVFEVQAVEVPS
jgi:hypothetical protein